MSSITLQRAENDADREGARNVSENPRGLGFKGYEELGEG